MPVVCSFVSVNEWGVNLVTSYKNEHCGFSMDTNFLRAFFSMFFYLLILILINSVEAVPIISFPCLHVLVFAWEFVYPCAIKKVCVNTFFKRFNKKAISLNMDQIEFYLADLFFFFTSDHSWDVRNTMLEVWPV